MEAIRHMLLGRDPCAALILAGLFLVVGSPLTRERGRARKAGCALGFLAAAGDAAYLWGEHEPTTVSQVANVALLALIFGLLATTAGWVAFGVLEFVHEHTLGRLLEAARRRREEAKRAREHAEWQAMELAEKEEAMRLRREEAERAAEERRRERERLANLPPPPTREQLAAAAKERYEKTLRLLEGAGLSEIELQAGREHAKQKYLKEIHEVMK